MESLNFKTNIQLKSIIGKDLINDDNIAILELVKNSFDADAKKVEVRYINLKNNDDKIITTYSDKTSRLIIIDDGVGMNFSDIQNKWLNIAYSEKKSNFRQHNRMMAGAKGVGRFSCDRLGEYLNLYARIINSDKYFLLKIDWKKFEVEDDKKEIQSINLEYEYLTDEDLKKKNLPLFKHGVLLEIIKLRSNWVYEIKDNKGDFINWNTEKLANLRKYLEKLINPNHAFEKNDFGIYLDAPEFIKENSIKEDQEKFIGKIENTIFDKLDFKATSVESKIIENGKIIYTELKDKGQTIFWIKEINEFFPEISNVKIILYYLNPYSKAFFTKQMGIRSVDYGSIYVFLNGFRIPPYGEYGDDWLYLEQRKSQGYARFLSQRELVGRIEILDDNNSFKVISSREGIEKNDSYKKLTDQRNGYFFKTFKRLEKYVVDGLDWDSIPENDKNKISDIEKKIISGQTKEDELVYRENDDIKKNRIYTAIHSIISAKPDNVIELYINETLIRDKINEEKENSEREYEQLISDFENKKIDGDILSRILQRKAEQNKDLEKQLLDFSKYTTNDATTKAIAELQAFKNIIENQTKLIKRLQKELSLLSKEKENVEVTIESYKERAERAERRANLNKEKFEIEKRKNVYLLVSEKKDISKDTETLIHSIKDASNEINASLAHIHRIITYKKYNDKDLLEYLRRIESQNKKTHMLSKLITHSDLWEEKLFVNIPDYIIDYIQINNIFDNPVRIKLSGERVFKAKINLIDIGIVIDELFMNAKKAGATEMKVEINITNVCELLFIDNGKGVSEAFIDSPNRIFELGISNTSGSGMGLNNAQRILKENYASLTFKGNRLDNKSGAIFKIEFK